MKEAKPKSDGCPVDHSSSSNTNLEHNPLTNDIKFDSTPLDSQKEVLQKIRAVSGIPKSEFTPDHQPGGVDNWVYPSEQQYYNAMKRKGYNPSEKDIPVILHIHNVVNEQGWVKIKEWEALRGNTDPRLKKFLGRPKDLSPKAFILGLLGYSKPFDRHDWVVERDGEEVRYVIDFYSGKRNPNPSPTASPISMYLDVRPAIPQTKIVHSVAAMVDIIGFEFRKRFSVTSLPKASLGTHKFCSELIKHINRKENKEK